MLKKSTVLLAVLAFSSLLFAQKPLLTAPVTLAGSSQSQERAAASPDSTTCSFTYSSGSGETFTRYCLTVNGNIIQLDSPSGFEYIAVGAFAEGYGFCDITSGTSYRDYAAFGDSGNWGATVVSAPNATTRKFVRTTTDGIWQLTQTIKQVKANASGPGSIQITMALKNLTAVSREIFPMVRYADVDAGGTTSDEIAQTKNSAFGSEGFNSGLLLANNTFTFPDHYAASWTIPGGADPCTFNTNRNLAAFSGDGSIGHLWHFTVPKLASKTVKLTYKPF